MTSDGKARMDVTIDPEIQGGTPCFSGTRVPVKSLFDALARGRDLDYFIEDFPSVKRDQAERVLRQSGELWTKRTTTAA